MGHEGSWGLGVLRVRLWARWLAGLSPICPDITVTYCLVRLPVGLTFWDDCWVQSNPESSFRIPLAFGNPVRFAPTSIMELELEGALPEFTYFVHLITGFGHNSFCSPRCSLERNPFHR
jgi:hypothetical protein